MQADSGGNLYGMGFLIVAILALTAAIVWDYEHPNNPPSCVEWFNQLARHR